MPSASSTSGDTDQLLSGPGTGSGTAPKSKPESSSSVDALAAQLAAVLAQPDGPSYANYCPSILLSLRPPTVAAAETSLHDYLADFYDFEENDNENDARHHSLQPHVYDLALRAYRCLRRTGQDQAIILHSACAVSATGQNEQRRLATRALLSVSSNPAESSSKSAKVARQIQAAEYILDAFGSVASSDSKFSSPRFGRYAELQFSDRGRIVGYKTLLHALDLDTGRLGFALDGVNGIQNRERSLNAVRWLVAGASRDERDHLRLPESGMSGSTAEQEDRERFAILKQAFKAFGFPKKAVASLCSTLAAILHISSLQFTAASSEDGATGCSVSSTDTLHVIASLLGLLDNPSTAQSNLARLEEAFTSKIAFVDGERCTVVLDVEKADENREQVAKVLYRLIWDWLGEYVNQKLERDDFQAFVALVDFPSLSNAPGHRNEGNTLSTMCLNMASERTSAFISGNLFSQTSFETQKSEDLPSIAVIQPVTVPPSVAETVRVFTNQPGGLVHIIDDQSVRKGKTEKTMLDAMGKRWGKNRQFAWRSETDSGASRAGTFTIEHWNDAELVTYSTENFLEKNLNLVPSDLVELLGGKAVPNVNTARRSTSKRHTTEDAGMNTIGGSANPFVRELFAAEVAALAASERITMGGAIPKKTEEESPESSTGLAVPGAKAARKPSMRRKPSTRKTGEDEEGGIKRGATLARKNTVAAKRAELLSQKCILGSMNTALNDMFGTLFESCRMWFLLCLTPSIGQAGNGADVRLIKSQVKALQLTSIRDRCASAHQWALDFEFKEFWDRYSVIDRWQGDLVKRAAALMWKDKMLAVKEEMDFSDRDMAVGKSRIFLSHDAFRQLEDSLRCLDNDEQKRKREFQSRSSDPEPDPYSPFSRPSIPLAVPDTPTLDQSSPFGAAPRPYNHPMYAATSSTAQLPLTGPDPFGEEMDSKSFLTADDYAQSRMDIETGRKTADFSTYELGKDMTSGEKGALIEGEPEKETVEVYKETRGRKQWKFLVWCFTWWIPSFLLTSVGRMKRADVRMAWREKVTIFMLITLMCGAAVFVVAIMGDLICPKEYVYTMGELAEHSYTNSPDNEFISIRGEVFDLTSFAQIHYPAVVSTRSVLKYGGADATALFPVQVSALCNGKDNAVSPWVTLDTSNNTDQNSVYHDFRTFTNDSRPDWYWEQMVFLRYNYRKGFIGYTKGDIKKRSSTASTRNTVIYAGNVYDMTGYISNGGGGTAAPAGYSVPSDTDRAFMDSSVVSLFQNYAGQDITKRFDSLGIDSNVLSSMRVCLRNLFFIGKVDSRNSAQCQFSRYILLAFSIVMVAIIGFKFIAALQFGRARQPESHDRFVILQVPCYTEGEDSLRECFESLAGLKYDDKRKLLFVICDGMIVGSGNDRPTPRIVLDILGADPALDPEPLSFQSLGEGAKQHNMGKVYSGLYEHAGHVIPYIVMVKVGKPSERSRPGNRGKRDSQMILMRFLNRVHFDAPMTPCELEIYHQIKNVIGVNPTFYEFLLAIDADTVVDPLSLNRFISEMTHDRKVIATCGETELANAKKSAVSMIQVYEYYISHHLAKAFESLFGSVTCLPGCFSLYRLRSVENKPIFISNDVVNMFGENRVDTLHMKNLLHLGEDRYLTTLLLKTFPSYKLTFTRDAHAKTIAPEDWKVLLSQRRRWINSTIHNLAELIGRVDRLCGFCCFSMRSVVLVDLLSTLIQPVTVAYIVYLIYKVAAEHQAIPTTALIMLAAIYGLQAIIFLLRRKFEMIVWMLIYILAIPVHSFLIPVYSFWKQDDFSWGQTRVVLGEQGKKLVIHDEGVFDPKEIPLKSWHEYENELWERGSNASIGQILAEKEEAAYAAGLRGEGIIYGHESNVGYPSGVPMGYGGAGSRPRTPMSDFGARSFHQALNSYSSGMPAGTRMSGHMTPGYARSQAGSVHGSPYQSGGYRSGQHSGYPSMSGMPEGYEMQGQNPFGSMSRLDSRQSFGGQSLGGMSLPLMSSQIGPNGEPSDEQLEIDIQAILAKADLQSLTKKGVREELEKAYGMDLTDRKAFINARIEAALSSLY